MSWKTLSLPAPGFVMEPRVFVREGSSGVGAEKTVADNAHRVTATKLVERMMAVFGY
jgi:hypothetical protein